LPSLGLAAPSAVAAAGKAFAQARQRYLAAAPHLTPRQVALAAETTDLMSTVLQALSPIGGITVPPALCGLGIAGADQFAPLASLPVDLAPSVEAALGTVSDRLSETIDYDNIVLPGGADYVVGNVDDIVGGYPDVNGCGGSETPAAAAPGARAGAFRGCHPSPQEPRPAPVPSAPDAISTQKYGRTAIGDASSYCDVPVPRNVVIVRTHRTCLRSRNDFQPPLAPTPWVTRRCNSAIFPGPTRRINFVRWYCRRTREWQTRDIYRVSFNAIPDRATNWLSRVATLRCG
jgi:hypothetical protein